MLPSHSTAAAAAITTYDITILSPTFAISSPTLLISTAALTSLTLPPLDPFITVTITATAVIATTVTSTLVPAAHILVSSILITAAISPIINDTIAVTVAPTTAASTPVLANLPPTSSALSYAATSHTSTAIATLTASITAITATIIATSTLASTTLTLATPILTTVAIPPTITVTTGATALTESSPINECQRTLRGGAQRRTLLVNGQAVESIFASLRYSNLYFALIELNLAAGRTLSGVEASVPSCHYESETPVGRAPDSVTGPGSKVCVCVARSDKHGRAYLMSSAASPELFPPSGVTASRCIRKNGGGRALKGEGDCHPGSGGNLNSGRKVEAIARERARGGGRSRGWGRSGRSERRQGASRGGTGGGGGKVRVCKAANALGRRHVRRRWKRLSRALRGNTMPEAEGTRLAWWNARQWAGNGVKWVWLKERLKAEAIDVMVILEVATNVPQTIALRDKSEESGLRATTPPG